MVDVAEVEPAIQRRWSDQAKARMQASGQRPLFLCNWARALFIHFECDADLLQPDIPYELDLWNGRACISLVAFTMERLRPCLGGRLLEASVAPIATHGFMNVRTYVRHRGNPGIYFMLEWLPNRLSVLLGPVIYGLPYRYGRLDYRHDGERGRLSGSVTAGNEQFKYRGAPNPCTNFAPCAVGSRSEFLMERYTAYTRRGDTKLLFHIWHRPWPQAPVEIELTETKLLKTHCRWMQFSNNVGANYSTGVQDVWVGAPQRC
jgi:uncharacterized protein YqjF (DUF2071 family)